MLKSIYIVCLLLAKLHPSQLDQDDSEENKGGLPKNVLSCSENVSKPTIDGPSEEVTIGWNVTLECVSQRGSPPIKYMLYRGRQMLQTISKDKAGEKALFNFVINSIDKLDKYKCKVVNKCINSTQYSAGFSFKVPKNNIAVFVLPPLLLIVLVVTILLLILWCRGRKSKSTSSHAGSVSTAYPASENCATYEKIAYENVDVAYTEVKFNTEDEDHRKGVQTILTLLHSPTLQWNVYKMLPDVQKEYDVLPEVILEEDTTVNYAEVAIRK